MSSQSSNHDQACQDPSAASVEQFLEYGLYLRNWSRRTVRAYRYALRNLPSPLTKQALDAWIPSKLPDREPNPHSHRFTRSDRASHR